ncbi:hypothetical protein GCM10027217_06230 [Pseudomaricurvus hydrocarbonicus]
MGEVGKQKQKVNAGCGNDSLKKARDRKGRHRKGAVVKGTAIKRDRTLRNALRKTNPYKNPSECIKYQQAPTVIQKN